MAEAKSEPVGRRFFEEMVFLLAGVLLIVYILSRLNSNLDGGFIGGLYRWWLSVREYFLAHIWPIWKIVAGLLSAGFVVWIVYSNSKLRAIEKEEKAIYHTDAKTAVSVSEIVAENNKNERWEKIIEKANSNTPADWRLAILDADIMLDELLRSKGYVGDSIGDMLKSVDKSDFLTLDNAWEAHKVRNRIAHDGAEFDLNERETKRVISLFESVFREFKIV